MPSKRVAIRLTGVSKHYKVFNRPLDRLKMALMPHRPGKEYYEAFEALKSLDLEIYRGETVGIIGSNGAGKSTLLQVICGTLQADAGEVHIEGKISALLELGAGFNPEFTGRENARINSMVMGLSPTEFDNKFDDMIAFADIGEFIDRPVKTYSTGMFARLAFSVAIHVDPEILIIDEALAVGDEAFQRKCYARLDRIKDEGATILLVSHSARAVQELCDRAVLLYKGECLIVDEAEIVVTQYQRLAHADTESHSKVLGSIRSQAFKIPTVHDMPAKIVHLDPKQKTAQPLPSPSPQPAVPDEMIDGFDPGLRSLSIAPYTEHGALIENVEIRNTAGNVVNELISGREYYYILQVYFLTNAKNVRFSMLLKSVTGVELGAQWSAPRGEGVANVESGSKIEVTLPFIAHFNSGVYFGNAGIQGTVDTDAIIMHRVVDVIIFRIRSDRQHRCDHYIDITGSKPSIRLLS